MLMHSSQNLSWKLSLHNSPYTRVMAQSTRLGRYDFKMSR